VARYAAFLRGINLARVNRLAMADLRTILGDLGYTDVKTHLQSGNAVLTTSAKAAKVERDVESAIRKEHGLEVPCLVRTTAQLRAVVDADPFGDVATDPSRYFVVFLSASLDEKVTGDYAPEEYRVIGREVYLWLPNGAHASKLAAAVSNKQTKVVATMRNWNTVTKMLALASDG
jgi:uncharacterized protein (DUF1697 family)